MPFYVQVKTRSSGTAKKGTPGQALAYITDDHDSKRETLLDLGEVEYIARTGEGWKTELEGGEIPLHGSGRLAGLSQEDMRVQFEKDCIPQYQKINGGTQPITGYKSITLTLPKEVSLFAEGHRKEAIEAMYAAIDKTLKHAYPNQSISAVSAVHTRNENGEVHYHAHVLVSKFARDETTKKWGSLNKKCGREEGRLKEAWTEGICLGIKIRLGVAIEQRADGKAVLTFSDGTRLDPLNRNSRREMEKGITPILRKECADGAIRETRLKLNSMDQKIYETAAGDRGKRGWNRTDFEKAFPGDAQRIVAFEKRVKTLQAVGYLNPEGRITMAFRNHAQLKWGEEAPELQAMRAELHRKAAKASHAVGERPGEVSLLEVRLRDSSIAARMDRLGVSEPRVQRVDALRKLAAPEFTKEERALFKVEKELKALPKARGQAVRAAPDLSEAASIQKRFAARQVELEKAILDARERVKEQRALEPAFGKAGFQGERRSQEQAIAVMAKRLESLDREKCAALAKAPDAAIRERLDAQFEKRRTDMEGRIQAARERFRGEKQEAPSRLRAVPSGGERLAGLASQHTRRLLPEEAQKVQESLGRLRNPSFKHEANRFVHALLPQELSKVVQATQQAVRVLHTAARAIPPGVKVPPEKVQELRIGLHHAVRQGGPDAALLRPWHGREEALARRVVLDAHGHKVMGSPLKEAVTRAGQQGARLADELRPRPPLALPKGLESRRAEIEQLQRRFEAYKVESPLTPKALQGLSLKQVDQVLVGGEAAALKGASAAWAATPPAAVAKVVLEIAKAAQRFMEQSTSMEKRLP